LLGLFRPAPGSGDALNPVVDERDRSSRFDSHSSSRRFPCLEYCDRVLGVILSDLALIGAKGADRLRQTSKGVVRKASARGREGIGERGDVAGVAGKIRRAIAAAGKTATDQIANVAGMIAVDAPRLSLPDRVDSR
jgi:hypothetical protein